MSEGRFLAQVASVSMVPELRHALAGRTFDHANDTRPTAPRLYPDLTAAELSNLRATTCPACADRDCRLECCDKCEHRHATTPIELSSGATRDVCGQCLLPTECDGGCKRTVPRWMLTTVPDAGVFCEGCCHVAPGANW